MLDTKGTWVGILLGATVDGHGLMIPIDLVIRDIEHVTGQKVIEPTFEPESLSA